MTIKLYGVNYSRAMRCLWMLEELGVPYEHIKTDFRGGGTRTPDYLKINPNGHVPALQDGDLTLFESMAINLYLAMKYNQGLWPAAVEDQARAIQWSIWGMTEVEPHLLAALLNRAVFPEDKRDEAKAAKGVETLAAGPFRILNDALAGKTYLVGDKFSVADVSLSALLSWTKGARADMSAFPNISAWLAAQLARPAYKAALARK